MKISCQNCGQVLPKTAVMCPNCGGRTFLPINDSAVNFTQPSAQTPNTWTNQPIQSSSPQPSYIPPVAPPTPQATYMPPVAPPIAPQPVVQPTYQPSYHQESYPQAMYEQQVLPPSAYDSRKLASQMLYAGAFKRGFAFVFDVVLVGLLLGLAYQLALPEIMKQFNIKGFNDQALLISAGTFYLWYMSIFTSSGRQGTIGKMMMGLWVYGMNGQRINFFHALFREMLKVVLLPLFFVMWFTARKQTMADLLARTVVLYDPS